MSRRNFTLKKTLIAGNRNLTIVCVSKWLEDFVRQSMYKNHDIRLIHNGIDLDLFKPVLPKGGEKFSILCIGNPMTRDKGLYDIYKLRTVLPQEEYEITIVGLKDNDLKKLPQGIKGMCRTTYRTGGSPEILSPETGIVVGQGDVHALADAIVRMRTHPFSSLSCRQRTERLYDKDERFADYISLYNSLIEK